MLPVKICGIRTLEDVAILNQYKPAMAGFILDYPQSHRYITPDTLARLSSALDPDILKVGVFVHPDASFIQKLHAHGHIQIAQLHMPEDPNLIQQLQSQGIFCIQVYEKPDAKALLQAEASKADVLLIDAGKGSGKPLDASILALLQTWNQPFILAGGLSPETLDLEALPAGTTMLDVSSGVETDNRKDPAKIRALMQMTA